MSCGKCSEGAGLCLEAEEDKCPECRVSPIPRDVRLLVCGGREWGKYVGAENKALSDQRAIEWTLLYSAIESLKPDVVIHGNAPGADSVADDFAVTNDIPVLRYNADWNSFGKAAGPIRNKKMIDEGKPTLVLAAPGGRGTANMIEQARRAGIPVVRLKTQGIL